jgi:polyhydroxybutyrate depolymerase
MRYIRQGLVCLTLFLFSLLAVSAEKLQAGDYRFALTVRGLERNYYLHIPPHTNTEPLPVVLSLHGGGGNAEQHRENTSMDSAANHDGYIAVYPNGSGRLSERLLAWNAGNCCAYAQTHQIDDVPFIASLIDDLKQRANIDIRRIYAVGHSNGGMMAHRLGEALPDKIAAIASVAGAHIPTSAHGRAMPVLHIHSEDDPRALFQGGLGPPFPLTGTRVLHPSVNATLSEWVRHDGCEPMAIEREFRENAGHTARQLVYSHCRDGVEVVLWKLTGAGHGWPGAQSNREALIGPSTQVIDANTEIWRFFSRYALPE